MNYKLTVTVLAAFLIGNEGVSQQDDSSDMLLVQVPYAELSESLRAELSGPQSNYFIILQRSSKESNEDASVFEQSEITPFTFANEYLVEYQDIADRQDLLAMAERIAQSPESFTDGDYLIHALVIFPDGPMYPGGGGGHWPPIEMKSFDLPKPYPGGDGGNWASIRAEPGALSEAQAVNNPEISSEIPFITLRD